jgi:hypothetical protein
MPCGQDVASIGADVNRRSSLENLVLPLADILNA